MFNFIISLFLGMFPDILYLTLFISFAKNLKEKRIKLFILLAIGYILLIMICQYQFLFYIVYIIYAFLILKLLYKSNICDFFLCSVALFYMTIISYVGYMLLSWNYALYYIVERLVVYSIFIFKNKFNLVYNKYLGSIIPFKLDIGITPVFNETLKYSKISPYLDGVKLDVFNNYLIPAINDGIVVFVGEKEGYGNTIILLGSDNIEVWYGNISNNVKLYDYVSKGNYIGDTLNDNLYLVFKRDGEILNYEEYLK